MENTLPVTPVEVFADESELEQVMLSLLIHVEHAVQDRARAGVRVNSRVLGSRVQITIDFSALLALPSLPDEPTSGDSFGLRVCQAIAQSHGGDIRLFETSQTGFRYELELPVHHAPLPTDTAPAPSRHASRVLTADADRAGCGSAASFAGDVKCAGSPGYPRRRSGRGGRHGSAHAVRCCVSVRIRLPGLSWIEFFKRVRRRVPGVCSPDRID